MRELPLPPPLHTGQGAPSCQNYPDPLPEAAGALCPVSPQGLCPSGVGGRCGFQACLYDPETMCPPGSDSCSHPRACAVFLLAAGSLPQACVETSTSPHHPPTPRHTDHLLPPLRRGHTPLPLRSQFSHCCFCPASFTLLTGWVECWSFHGYCRCCVFLLSSDSGGPDNLFLLYTAASPVPAHNAPG